MSFQRSILVGAEYELTYRDCESWLQYLFAISAEKEIAECFGGYIALVIKNNNI